MPRLGRPPTSIAVGKLTPASPTSTTLLLPPQDSAKSEVDDHNDAFARVMDLLRQVQSTRDRIRPGSADVQVARAAAPAPRAPAPRAARG